MKCSETIQFLYESDTHLGPVKICAAYHIIRSLLIIKFEYAIEKRQYFNY